MQKHLYFVCPTDHLVTVINDEYEQENYFLTSLGNSILLSPEIVEEVNGLVEAKKIREITFVLSDRNRMILDALEHQVYTEIQGLKDFYSAIDQQKVLTDRIWQINDRHIPVVSCYLAAKIRELQQKLRGVVVAPVTVNARIYKRDEQLFSDVLSEVYQMGSFNLN